MKKLFALLTTLALISPIFAADFAHINIDIADPVKENKYFLCLYGVGCLSIRAGDHGKAFATLPVDLSNINKMVITDVTDMRMYMQPNVKSCSVKVNAGQQVTITGQLVVENNVPRIKNLSCHVTA